MNRIAALLLVIPVMAAAGADQVFENGPQRVHLVELFTSQGCSSCPPAEAWLSKLKSEPRLWKDFVPVAFHVDYWDRLGWRDPYASKEWTARQSQYSDDWKFDSVYTPAFVLDGRELHVRVVPPPSNAKAGTLKLTLANKKLIAAFVPGDGATKDLELHVAALGCDLTTKVTGGENNGHNLTEDFVVLSVVNDKMPGGKVETDFALDPRARAIAAWVTAPNQLEPIQAIGGWINR